MAFLTKSGLERLWLHIVSKLGTKVDKVEGKGLSTNDYTTAEKEQLSTLSELVGDTAVSTQINTALSVITYDSALSDTSTNPVQNKVINTAIDDLQDQLDTALLYKGSLSSSVDCNSTTIASGIYGLSGSSNENLPLSNMYGIFIQFSGTYKVQIVVSSPASTRCTMYMRRYLTGSSKFTDWETAGISECITGLSVSGQTITYTRGDGTTGTITTQDTNTEYTLSSFGITATASELNILDGVTATTAEINYIDGVTSNIQTQLDAKANKSEFESHTHDSIQDYSSQSTRYVVVSATEPSNPVEGMLWFDIS